MEHGIVIVGGGAGGLELASKLGRALGPSKVTLVDSRLSHIWKPSLHEVAAGTLDIHQEGLSYQMLAHDNGFTFVYGALTAMDSKGRTITVGAVLSDAGEVLIPERVLTYEALVLAVGSTSNYFGVEGAAEHTISLNATEDAEHFRLQMLKLLTAAEQRKSLDPTAGVDIVIIGGGATGVELAAELREASAVHANYGRKLDPTKDIRITILEGAPRILAPLPERVSKAAAKLLARRQVTVKTECRVTKITPEYVEDKAGTRYRADICVWAAGIRAPSFLATLGLPVNKAGQLEVGGNLKVKGEHGYVFAIGDCAACTTDDGVQVPPRAQAAHQQADFLCKFLKNLHKHGSFYYRPFAYKDYGSLVSVGSQTSVGSLMGSLKGASWFIEGTLARMMYVSLHLLHHRAVMGSVRTGVLAVARFLIKRTTPLVKLH